jgi:hypothetical protein
VNPRLLLAALCLLPSLGVAQTAKVQENDPASQAIPTAAELSEPGALQAYVESKHHKGEICQLPPGVIKGNVWINKDSVILRGCGCPCSNRKTGTVIVPADDTKPAITIREALNVQLADFGIQDAPLAVSLVSGPRNMVFHTTLRDVGISDAKVGVRVSEPPDTRQGQNAAADLVIDHCFFTGVESGVEMNHNQTLNVHVIGQSYFYRCGTAVMVNNGGRILIADSCCNGLGTWLRIHQAGGNLVPNVLRNIYSDRSGGTPAPIIVDARGCKGRVRVLVDVYTCPIIPSDGPWADVTHRHFYGPDGSADAAANSIIKIADLDFFNAPGVTTP